MQADKDSKLYTGKAERKQEYQDWKDRIEVECEVSVEKLVY